MRVLFPVKPAQKTYVILWFGDKRKMSWILAIVNNADVLQARAALLLVVGNRNVEQVLSLQIVLQIIEINRPMNGGQVRKILKFVQVKVVRMNNINPFCYFLEQRFGLLVYSLRLLVVAWPNQAFFSGK